MRSTLLFFFILILPCWMLDESFSVAPPFMGECTIGIFSGQSTVDGRPILWKNRDVTNAVQKFCYFSPISDGVDSTLAYIANCYSNDTTRVYMGVNEAGFAIMNANSYNLRDILADGIDDGRVMRLALERCRSLTEFESILDATSLTGRQDTWNFGAIDAFGNAAMYECANYHYAKYNALDSLNEGSGLIVRATFSLSGDSVFDGFPRYKRATHLVHERLRDGGVDVEFVLQKLARDLANPIDDPYPLPYDGVQNGRPEGFIYSRDVTINRTISRSLVVIQGVAPGEDPCLSTVWGMIGPPVLSVAYPMWVRSQSVPEVLNSGLQVPMYVQVMQRHGSLYSLMEDDHYLDSRYLMGKSGSGLFAYTLPLESSIIETVEGYLENWRLNIPAPEIFSSTQLFLADSIYQSYLRIPSEFPNDIVEYSQELASVTSYPNPFNISTTISLTGFEVGGPVAIGIYNMLGQLVVEMSVASSSGPVAIWDGRDRSGEYASSGVYLINATNSHRSATVKTVLMK
jgi:hypothetical protein